MPQRSAIAVIDTIILRVLVPIWLLAGALFKLIERNPGNLPSTIISFAKRQEMERWLNPFMRVAIGVEIFAAALIIFVPKVSRTVAIVMLTIFCAILVAEIRSNATSCGCMGSVTMSPKLMIAIDGSLLLGAIVFGLLRKAQHVDVYEKPSKGLGRGAGAAALVGIAGFVAALALPERTVVEQPTDVVPTPPQHADAATTPGPDNAAPATTPAAALPPGTMANPNPTPLPSFYITSPTESWIGKPATDVDLVKLMRIWPDDIATGTRYIIFYSRTCDHCEAMFNDHLTLPHDRPITVVEIPASATELRGPNPWDMPNVDAQQLALPVGPNWVMTPPIIIAIDNGVVSCAMEAGFEDCLVE